MAVQSVIVKLLRPTQIAVGKQLVKMKRKGLRERERKPQELVDFILANPIRVVLGPNDEVHIIDHHHLGYALMKEDFKTAPVQVESDLSKLSAPEFWKAMEGKAWVHAFDGKGRARKISDIPDDLMDMEDDPYRSLAGVVRQEGGFIKTLTPYMEFAWADYFRPLIKSKALKADFTACVHKAKILAAAPEASALPGYIAKSK
jgi:hypothetical protein